MSYIRRCFVLGALLGSTFWVVPSEVQAHSIPSTRRVTMQVDHAGVAMLAEVVLHGRDAALMWSVHDTDKNNEIDSKEGKQLGQAALRKALSGVVLYVDGKPVERRRVRTAEHRVDARSTSDEVRVLALLEIDAPKKRGAVGIEVSDRQWPLAFEAHSLGDYVMNEASSKKDLLSATKSIRRTTGAGAENQSAGPFQLKKGDRIDIQYENLGTGT